MSKGKCQMLNITENIHLTFDIKHLTSDINMLIKKIIIKSVVQTINFLNFKPILNQNNMKNLTTFTKKANWLKTFNFF